MVLENKKGGFGGLEITRNFRNIEGLWIMNDKIIF